MYDSYVYEVGGDQKDYADMSSSLLLYLLFFPHATPLTLPSKAKAAPSYRTAITVFAICVVHLVVVFIISLSFIFSRPASLRPWAEFIGVFGTVLAAVQFLPQIWTTWTLQEVGSLSIPSMCIQTPGSFVWVGSLAARLGWEGWSTWGIYLVTGILQGILLVMSIGFEVRDLRRRQKEFRNRRLAEGEGGGEVDERTNLVGNERR